MRRALLAALLLAAACSGDDGSEVAAKPCDGLLRQADTTVRLPARIPSGVTNPVLYERQQLGATELYYGQAEGADVVTVRDTIAGAFERAGFSIESRDEEPPAEAEFQFTTAKDEGSVQVTPLCAGHVTIRWRVGPK